MFISARDTRTPTECACRVTDYYGRGVICDMSWQSSSRDTPSRCALGCPTESIEQNATTFEIVSFALIKVHLEKFACKIYRDTRTSAHDRDVDFGTNFGVVYQVKKLRVHSRAEADKIYAELKLNFDAERLQDGNVILVIDDIAEDVRRYLIDMKVQSIRREHLLDLARGFTESEDRQKVLRVIYEEFRRDFSSNIS